MAGACKIILKFKYVIYPRAHGADFMRLRSNVLFTHARGVDFTAKLKKLHLGVL